MRVCNSHVHSSWYTQSHSLRITFNTQAKHSCTYLLLTYRNVKYAQYNSPTCIYTCTHI